MKITIHKAEERGAGEYGWLSTRYSFSFSSWYNPERMGFGALRVLNDDRIAPGAGFPPHSHKDMEIITIVTEGAVAHKDSTGGEGIVHSGEVQVMSAGSGVVHSEYNASDTEPLTLFQLWILTAKKDVAPRYEQKAFDEKSSETILVAPIESPFVTEGDALGIHQDAYITRIHVRKEMPHTYQVQKAGNGIYVFVISGTVFLSGERFSARDAVGITDVATCDLQTEDEADVLIIEVPMIS